MEIPFSNLSIKIMRYDLFLFLNLTVVQVSVLSIFLYVGVFPTAMLKTHVNLLLTVQCICKA